MENQRLINKWGNKKKAAICFSIDDIHPQKSTDYYESGGDLEKGVMKHLLFLLKRHPQLKVTLFTTADWREISPYPTRKILASIPLIKDRAYLTKRFPKGAMQLNNHPEFISFLKSISQAEIALHGLYHCHTGRKIPIEFQDETEQQFEEILSEMIRIFELAELPFVYGMCPPGWDAPENLISAMIQKGVKFLASARDIVTPVKVDAQTNMSGLKNVSLIFPELICNGQMIHFPANFQATSESNRAIDIIEAGGLLSIKAHITPYTLDCVNAVYMNYLDVLLFEIERKYGDEILWTSMGEITDQVFN